VNPARFPRLPSETPDAAKTRVLKSTFIEHAGDPERTQQPIFAEPERVAKSKRTQHHRWFRSGGRALEPHVAIRTQVIAHDNAPRVSHVAFNVSVGAAVPTTVRLAPVPTVLVDIHPAWRSHEYFLYNEQVIIVDPNDWYIEVIVLL
jgi:hypothetical protein